MDCRCNVLAPNIRLFQSLIKKFTVDENVTAMSFSHDGGSIVVGTETGRVLQLNLRSMDKPAQAVVVDSTGGRIGGLAIATTSTLVRRKNLCSCHVVLTLCREHPDQPQTQAPALQVSLVSGKQHAQRAQSQSPQHPRVIRRAFE